MFTPKRVFVPRNINKRDKELELIKDEKIKNFKLFLSEFKYNLKAIKNQKSDPSFSSTQYYKIGKGKYSYEYVLDQMSDGRWKYSGTFEVFNYTDSDKHWDFYLFSGDNAGSMYGGRMPDVPKNVEVGYKETLPEQVIELSGGKIIITNREKIN